MWESGFDSRWGHQNLTFEKLTDFFVGGAKRRPLILWGECNAFLRADARLSARQDEVRASQSAFVQSAPFTLPATSFRKGVLLSRLALTEPFLGKRQSEVI